MQIKDSPVDIMARQLCKNAIKVSKGVDDANYRWIALSLLALAHSRAAALIEKKSVTMKNRMEKGNSHAEHI